MADQLHISNFPMTWSAELIRTALDQQFPGITRVVPLRKGFQRPFGRMSCFVHWTPGCRPNAEDVTGFLPWELAATGWNVSLVAKHVNLPVSRQHCEAQSHVARPSEPALG
jgi:hypothetical protein